MEMVTAMLIKHASLCFYCNVWQYGQSAELRTGERPDSDYDSAMEAYWVSLAQSYPLGLPHKVVVQIKCRREPSGPHLIICFICTPAFSLVGTRHNVAFFASI